MPDFAGKRYLVTCTASDIGHAVATKLLAAGAEVHSLDRNQPTAAVTRHVTVDLADVESIDEALAELDADPTPYDALLNVAGVPGTAPADVVMRVNTFAARHLAEAMFERLAPGGNVVIVSSTAGFNWAERLTQIMELLATDTYDEAVEWFAANPQEGNAYNFSKECTTVYTLSMGLAFNEMGFRLNAVLPGPVETPILADFEETMGADTIGGLKELLGRHASADDIADAVLFLASDEARWVNGHALIADGGVSGSVLTGLVPVPEFSSPHLSRRTPMTTTTQPDTTHESADSTDLADMLATLRQVHTSGRTRDVAWRRSQLEALSRFCDERESEIAAAMASDLGRNAFDTWLGEIAGTQGEISFALKNLKKWMKPRRHRIPMSQQPGSAQVRYEPLGVVLVIGPWNYPVFLCLSPVVAAVAAGNCVVVKPSELAPATSRMLADLLPRYLDPEAVKVVEGDGATTQELLALGFDHALFTGGTEIGKKIMAAAAATLTPVTLELGGKSPVVVAPDADIAVAARRLAWTKLLNSGQTCIAPDYVLVHRSRKDELVAELRTAIAEQQVESPDGLRIVNERQFDRLVGYLAATKGTVAVGGTSDAATLRMQPTVLVDVDPDEPSMTDEIFGPILPVLAYDDLDETIRFINARSKPLALYVFTKDTALADKVIDAVPSGGAVVNHVALHCLMPSLPFGGVGDSGMGAYHGEWGFQALSHRKAVLRKTFTPDLRLAYPPYDLKAQKLMRKLF